MKGGAVSVHVSLVPAVSLVPEQLQGVWQVATGAE